MKKTDFFFDLPKELIAQIPIEKRDNSKLLHLDKDTGEIYHSHFYDICRFLKNGDCLILNDSKVLPARIYGTRVDTGARVEFLLLNNLGNDSWEVLAGPGKKAKPGYAFTFGNGILKGEVTDILENGNRIIKFEYSGRFFEILDIIGQMPLPHYIKEELSDKGRYQTVYANIPGSAAAPTAGLHFTPELLEKIKEKGINVGFVTLHVGLGTFRPVKADDISEHVMHSEHFYVPQETSEMIREAKDRGGRVIAVGTTSCRTLESSALLNSSEGFTDIFITPGYEFKVIDGLITNFHLPESTLIMLVSAFAGYKHTMQAYSEAIREKYRFYSFGDSMIII